MYLSVRLNSKEPMRKNIPVAKELIERILQAGMMAPSSKNRQPWKFIVASGQDQERLIRMWLSGEHDIRKNTEENDYDD